MTQKKVTAPTIKHALSRRHKDDFFLTEVKDGPTWFKDHVRIDAWAMKKSWSNPHVLGYEVKVSRSDFLNDTKWPSYLSMCNSLSFVCPKGLIKPDEIDPQVGLIYYNPEKKSLYTAKKALYRNIEIKSEMFQYILMSRITSQEYPFFSSKREFFEQWIVEKKLSYELGQQVSTNISKLVRAKLKDNNKASSEILQLKEIKQDLDLFKNWCKDNGIPLWLDMPKKLEAISVRLQKTLDPKIEAGIVNLFNLIKK
jgi:hypothetical protein